MSTVLTAPSKGETILFSVTPETVAPMAEKYLALRINGIGDKAGAEIVRRARLDCVKARTVCEKEHKTAKEDALRECQRIDKSRRDMLALIAPIEKHLEDQEKAIADELAAIARKAADELHAKRLEAWTAVEGPKTDREYLLGMNDDQFAARIEQQREAMEQRKAEQERLAAEREQQRIEREKLEAERAELNRQREAQEAETARLRKIEDDRRADERKELDRQQAELDKQRREVEAEQRRLQEEAAERQRKADAERIAAEAAERARVETEARLKREADEAESRRLAEVARQEREAAQRPDREKMIAVASAIEAIPMPEVAKEFASNIATIRQSIAVAVRQIRVAATAQSK